VNERDAFVRYLEKHPDDQVARSVFVDWLDEHGDHGEAERMRNFPAARKWLIDFAWEMSTKYVRECPEDHPDGQPDPEDVVTYEYLVVAGLESMEEGEFRGSFSCSHHMDLCDTLRGRGPEEREFWRNWSVVTGRPNPLEEGQFVSYHCGC
jgi:uncharacterized protein (TIGR02996 family)